MQFSVLPSRDTPSCSRRMSQPAAADTSTDAAYMVSHGIPGFVEHMLACVVPCRHPRPHEAIALLPIVSPGSMTTQSDPIALGKASSSVEHIDSLEFDVFACDASPESFELVEVALLIFRKYNILAKYSITVPRFLAWSSAVRNNYRRITVSATAKPAPPTTVSLLEGENELPYHNYRHAINVLQTLHVFLHSFGLQKYFNDIEIFAMLYSAICHDLQHPGRDEAFLTRTGSPIARRYHGAGMLERHHCAIALSLLEDPALDICSAFHRSLNGLPTQDFLLFEEMVCDCIMGTSVAEQTRALPTLKGIAKTGADALQRNESHRRVIMASLLAAADLGDEARSFPFSRQWAVAAEEEACRQGDAEALLGLPVPPSRNRELVVMSRVQCSVIDEMTAPLFGAVASIFPQLSECARNVTANRATWKALADATVNEEGRQ